jgi:multiple sugar transport system substrate-binding protein
MIKKYNLDLGKFDPTLIQAVKTSAESDNLLGMPYTMHFGAMYYNKDLFDKFSVSYPADGMTWDEAIELSKKLTRTEGGVSYRGLEPDVHVIRQSSQLSLPLIDPKTHKAVLSANNGWKNVFDMEKRLYDAQGVKSVNNSFSRFVKNRTYAMFPSLNMISELGLYPDLNWDMATYPVFKEAPGKGPQFDAHVMLISSTTKDKDAAFRIITVLVSDEVQTAMARHARVPALKDPKLKEVFGQDIPYLQGKRVASAFKTSPAAPYVPTQFVNIANAEAENALKEVVKGNVDINTALRNADEIINKKIEELTK